MNQLIIAALDGKGAAGSTSGLGPLRGSVDSRYSKGLTDSELSQWISLSKDLKLDDLSSISTLLSSKTYLCGISLSIADAALVLAMQTSKFADQVKTFPSLARYTVYIQSQLKPQNGIQAIDFTPSSTPVPIGTGIKAVKTEVSESKPATTNGDAKSKEEKKEKKEKAPAVAAATTEELEPSLLDIRVGVIKKCWNHPDSDKLLCEEVDCGEAEVRSIASGIRAFYTAEEFVGKRVMVLANLKARAIAGFKSEGMVLCACNEDHSKVAILEPPADAAPGAKVEYKGFEGKEAAIPNAVTKKKILEKLAPGLKTDDKGIAWSGKHQFFVDGKPCTSVMTNAQIS